MRSIDRQPAPCYTPPQMKARFVASVLLAGLLSILGAFALACGEGGGGGNGSGDPHLDFFQQLQQLNSDYQLQGEVLAQDFQDTGATAGSEQERVTAIRALLGQTLAEFKRFIDGVKGLDPPPEFSTSTIVAAGERGIQGWEGLIAQLDAITSEEEAKAAAEEFFTSSGFEGVDKPCFIEQALQIDLGCAGVEG